MLANEAIKAKRDIAKSKLSNDENITILNLKIEATKLRAKLKESELTNQMFKSKTEKQSELIKKLTESMSEMQNENQYLNKKLKKYLREKMSPMCEETSKQKETPTQEGNSKLIQSIYRYTETPNEHLRIEICKRDKQLKEYKNKLLEHLSDRNELLDIFRACVTATRKEWEKRKVRFTKSDKL